MSKEEKQETNGRTPYFTINIPGTPFCIKFGGKEVVMLLCAGFIAYIVNEHDNRTKETVSAMVQALNANTTAISSLSENQAGIIYMLSLEQTERKALQITKPPSVRKLQKRGDE